MSQTKEEHNLDVIATPLVLYKMLEKEVFKKRTGIEPDLSIL